jgi:hypothetical protein
MTVNVGDILQIVAVMSWLDGNIMQNVFHTEITAGTGPFDHEDVGDDMQTWVEAMYAELVAGQSDECDGSEIRVYVWDTGDADWDEISTKSFTYNPTNAGDQVPRGVSALINAKTDDADVNGKKYLGGFTEASSVDGLLAAAEIVRLVAFAAEWLPVIVGGVSGASFDAGVWSVKNTALYDLTGTFTIPAIWAYQRRRKRGIGI